MCFSSSAKKKITREKLKENVLESNDSNSDTEHNTIIYLDQELLPHDVLSLFNFLKNQNTIIIITIIEKIALKPTHNRTP